jgi:hypothetical protein
LKEKKIGVRYLSTKHTLKMRKVVHHSSSMVIKGEDQGAEWSYETTSLAIIILNPIKNEMVKQPVT